MPLPLGSRIVSDDPVFVQNSGISPAECKNIKGESEHRDSLTIVAHDRIQLRIIEDHDMTEYTSIRIFLGKNFEPVRMFGICVL